MKNLDETTTATKVQTYFYIAISLDTQDDKSRILLGEDQPRRSITLHHINPNQAQQESHTRNPIYIWWTGIWVASDDSEISASAKLGLTFWVVNDANNE